MKIWIAKNSEVPVREQLIAQITLGIAAGDFKIGEKLPSTREVARRCDLHPNTVGSAYQKLVEQNLLEFKKGSGFYVTESAGERLEGTRQLEQLIDEFLASAKTFGFDEKDVMRRFKERSLSPTSDELIVIESDSGLRQILVHELSAHFRETLGISVEEYRTGGVPEGAILTAMFDEKAKIEPHLNGGQRCTYLKGRSVSTTMTGQARPRPDDLVAVVSGWEGFLTFARIMLLAANVDPGNLVVRSTSDDGWKEAIKNASMIICDTATAATLDGVERVRSFQIISDESLEELRKTANRT